jgi:hypothetical protein
MRKATLQKNVDVLLALAKQLAATPNMTWIDANNVIYAPGGPLVRLFPTKADRLAYSKTPESRQIDELIDSLPEPPVRRGPREDWTEFMIPVDKPPQRRPRQRAGSGRR